MMEELLPLENRTELEILHSMLTHLHGLGMNISEAEIQEALEGRFNSNQYIMDLDTHAYALAEDEALIGEVDSNVDLATAVGESLDRLGRLMRIARLPALPGRVDVICSENLSGESVVVPGGTRVLLDDVAGAGLEYVTCEEVTVLSGTGSTVIPARSVDEYFVPALPAGVVRGLAGFQDLVCGNVEGGVPGRDIESDEEYRARLLSPVRFFAGSQDLLDDFLSSYEGVSEYRLVPCFSGVGSLKIVVDAVPSLYEVLPAVVHRSCMDFTDPLPVVVAPESTVISELSLSVVLDSTVVGLNVEEIRQLLVQQVGVFVDGGTRRNGESVRGLGIGSDFVPSQLVRYLLGEVPECLSIVLDDMDIVEVPATHRLRVDSVEVTIE
jgi:hypothetical protein